MTVEIGSVVPGTVLRIAEYGVIVRLVGGGIGLVHISEITDKFVRAVGDYFTEGEQVMVRILELSTKDVPQSSRARAPESVPPPQSVPDAPNRPPASEGRGGFEEKLSKFLKESEQRLTDLRRNMDSKRRGGRHRS
jgi:S1 RNA binding domain protein